MRSRVASAVFLSTLLFSSDNCVGMKDSHSSVRHHYSHPSNDVGGEDESQIEKAKAVAVARLRKPKKPKSNVTNVEKTIPTKDHSTSPARSIRDAGSIIHVPPTTRANRFPSVEQRVKLYMSNWYSPPCEYATDQFVRYRYERASDASEWKALHLEAMAHGDLTNGTLTDLKIESIVEPDTLFFMDKEILQFCARDDIVDPEIEVVLTPREQILSERIKGVTNMQMYCYDIKKMMLPALRHVEWGRQGRDEPEPPTLLQFGDNKNSHGHGTIVFPHMKKFRSAATSQRGLDKLTSVKCHDKPREMLHSVHGTQVFQPIIWKLATHRHFGYLSRIQQWDTPWSQKMNKAIFRGQLTGAKDNYLRHESDFYNCMHMKRCKLVYDHVNSTLLDAKLTSTRRRIPDVLNGIELVTLKSYPDELLKYKGLVMIEGNDVASGLKWALLSQSVVLMPVPKHTSWAMEELLEPWVHYVPLDDEASNVEELMQWVIDHDAEAQKIAERATLWMEDLVFHPDAAEDDRLIQEEIMRRYQAHFAPF